VPPASSRSAIDALGRRLAQATPSPADLEALSRLQAEYRGALEAADAEIRRELGAEPKWKGQALTLTGRVKTPTTLIEKLRRPGASLSSVQDVVGLRIVGDLSLRDQDELADRLRVLFAEARIVDRRALPTHGYRAIHVIARVSGFPVEIQVRTLYQHVWANATERLADTWGRGIRYGLPPGGRDESEARLRGQAVEKWRLVSSELGRIEQERLRLTDTIAARVVPLLLKDPFADPGELAKQVLAADPSLMSGVDAAAGAMRAALEAGGVVLSALLASTMEELDPRSRK